MENPFVENVFKGVELDGWGSYQIDRLVAGATMQQVFGGYGKEDIRELCFPGQELDWFSEKHQEKLNHGHRNVVLTEELHGIYAVHFFLCDDLPPTIYKEKISPGEFRIWVSEYRCQVIVPEQ